MGAGAPARPARPAPTPPPTGGAWLRMAIMLTARSNLVCGGLCSQRPCLDSHLLYASAGAEFRGEGNLPQSSADDSPDARRPTRTISCP